MGRSVSVKLVVVILLLGIICFVFYRYALSPQIVQLRDLRDQVTQAEAKLSTLKEVQRLQDAFIKQNESYTSWIGQLVQVTPAGFDQHQHTLFLLDLQAVGKVSGIAYTSIQITDASIGQGGGGTATKQDGMTLPKTVGVTMNFTAKDYWTVRRFDETLRSKFKYIMVLSNLTVSHTALGTTGQGNPYSCSMTAWMVLTPDAAIPGAPAAAAPVPQADVLQ